MNRFTSLICLLSLSLAAALGQTAGKRTIPLAELKDKIAGGWAGQMIGVSYGAPTEFRARGEMYPVDKLPKWSPEKVDNSLNQDDLYVDMTFAKVLDDKGLGATTADFGAMFRDAKYALWHANLASRRMLKRGVPAELAGTPQYNAHANDIDFQIESDFIGLMAPGLYNPAIDIALRAGRVMNSGDGLLGGVFVSCMYSAAFFEKDPHKVVETGLACLPPKSPYALLIADLIAAHRKTPNDFEGVWKTIEDKWDKRDPCPSGALSPFNIDAKLNGAYIAMGLLFGDGDMEKTIVLSTRAGQDSDCNPSSAAGVLGVMLGYKAIPDLWKGGIEGIADRKFRYTDFNFRTIVDSTYTRALALAKQSGGKVEGDNLVVTLQKPKPPKVELWDDYGSPVERIAVTDARWRLTGDWASGDARGTTKRSSTKGATAEIDFEGTGFIVVGPYLPDGGKVDVFLDGVSKGILDVYSDEDAAKGGESVFHAFRLKPGKHTVKLVVRGEPYPGSKGAAIALNDVVVFR
jgi:hypothetical protein